ncbi:ABC transporter permease [Roseisalinus antarcticus]|uniref:Putative aliphatic sulfonates transport permease protein SsuC n=1 Tax=Roseisalinus antarcticus TaxID=254357 RepID=A0A1Y5TX61_9RHOB|nr:ABC transporter permease subunit [Roseisalinus antarcticus]SLN75553.1 Putative aliphatic sulfonates transport permease protein SsuC [Roseisalinus antarcticus]
MERFKEYSAQIASLIIILLGWEISALIMDTRALPPASESFADLVQLIRTGDAFGPLGSTLFRTTCGFALGFVMGCSYGIAAVLSRTFDDLSKWLLQIAMFTPTLILIFLFLVIFGRTSFTVILLIGLVVLPVVGTYIRDSLRDFDEELDGMAASYKAPLRQRVFEMYLPFLIPSMLAAGRIGFTLSWKVGFLAEIFGFSNGLGWQIRTTYQIYDVAKLLAWLSLFILTLLVIEQMMRFAERRVVKW